MFERLFEQLRDFNAICCCLLNKLCKSGNTFLVEIDENSFADSFEEFIVQDYEPWLGNI